MNPFDTFLAAALAHEQPRDDMERLRMGLAYWQGCLDGQACALAIHNQTIGRMANAQGETDAQAGP